MKDENCDVSISNIILRTANKKFSQKGHEVNIHLKDMCKKKYIYLINNTNKIKAQHLNKGKRHINKRGSNILSTTFVSELSRILTWSDKNTTGFFVEECKSDKTNADQEFTDGNRVLKSLRCNNLNKLVFAHLNFNSIGNKFELLSEQVRGNVDVLVVSETTIDDSFPIANFLIHG